MKNTLHSLLDRSDIFRILDDKIAIGKEEKHQIAVLIIQISRLREINAEYGFETGDLILKEILKRIDDIRRQDDTLGRITGSDFGLILPSLHSVGQAILAAQKIIKISRKPV